jgi:hypothetical protein
MPSDKFKVGDSVTGATGRTSAGWSGRIVKARDGGYVVRWKERENHEDSAVRKRPELFMLPDQIVGTSQSDYACDHCGTPADAPSAEVRTGEHVEIDGTTWAVTAIGYISGQTMLRPVVSGAIDYHGEPKLIPTPQPQQATPDTLRGADYPHAA